MHNDALIQANICHSLIKILRYIWYMINACFYTVSQKTSHLWLAIILTYTLHNYIVIIFGISVPPHLSSASALPCERGNLEDSACMLYACNAVQLLQNSWRPFSWTMPLKSPRLNALPKNVKIRSCLSELYSKPKVGRFFETWCISAT